MYLSVSVVQRDEESLALTQTVISSGKYAVMLTPEGVAWISGTTAGRGGALRCDLEAWACLVKAVEEAQQHPHEWQAVANTAKGPG